MTKKKSPAPFPMQAVLMAVVFLMIGFVLGKKIDINKLITQTPDQVMEERAYIGEAIELPQPRKDGRMSVEKAMQERRSKRAYTDDAMALDDVSQILWAIQGQTADWGGRTVPSAKGAYPLNVTVVAKNVDGLEAGVYHFDSATHSLMQVMAEIPAQFDEAAVQGQNKKAPVAFILSGDYTAMTKAFDGKSNDQNVVLEAGHAGQNVYLQVESLGLGTVVSGGFNKVLMKEILDIPAQEDLFYLIPVGIPATQEAATH
ncbi:MAG: SagB/ThcOx family dehydrogenase [Candidatus Pacebacteria bacterium]|nr:SagB/ThcOx family dehydrogenase [Candidatus Paceibacterota bacterium]